MGALAVIWGAYKASKLLQIASLVLLGWGAFQANNAYQRKQGGDNVVATINEQVEEQVEEAVQAREPAKLPGSVERLRAGWCRDCR
jgi:hypothetical protein